MFTLTNIWMIQKNLVKLFYLKKKNKTKQNKKKFKKKKRKKKEKEKKKKNFTSYIDMKDITGADYTPRKKVC